MLPTIQPVPATWRPFGAHRPTTRSFKLQDHVWWREKMVLAQPLQRCFNTMNENQLCMPVAAAPVASPRPDEGVMGVDVDDDDDASAWTGEQDIFNVAGVPPHTVQQQQQQQQQPKAARKRRLTSSRSSRNDTSPEVEADLDADPDEWDQWKTRLPLQTLDVLQTSSYYLSNRKIFMQKLTSMLGAYTDELKEAMEKEEEDAATSCSNNNNDVVGSEEPFRLLPHQRLIRDYINLYSPYRGLLLYFALGSGKTCSAIAIAEGMKSKRRIIVLTPASLADNFKQELRKCGDPLFKQNQYWNFMTLAEMGGGSSGSGGGGGSIKSMLSKTLGLSDDYIQKHGGLWVMDTREANSNFATLTADQQEQINKQIDAMMDGKYLQKNYNGLRKAALETWRQGGNPFDGAVVIIDEVHKFVNTVANAMKRGEKNSEDHQSVCYQLYKMILDADDARVVCLTGTPIVNYAYETGILFNMLRGYIVQWNLNLKKGTRTETVRQWLQDAGIVTYDWLEVVGGGKTLSITRNPMGFINYSTPNPLPTVMDNEVPSSRPKTLTLRRQPNIPSQSGTRTRRKRKFIEVQDDADADTTATTLSGGAGASTGGGVVMDERGQISNREFLKKIKSVLLQHGIDVVSIDKKKYTALPEHPRDFDNRFIANDRFVHSDLFQRRILGLVSYYRSADVRLLPSFVKSPSTNDPFHIIQSVMSPEQLSYYSEKRLTEIQMEKSKKRKQMGTSDETSSYKVWSRLACNYAFPDTLNRPTPHRRDEEFALDFADSEDKPPEDTTSSPVLYQQQLDNLLTEIANRPREFLSDAGLLKYGPKYYEIIRHLQPDDYPGLHLVYSQFRRVEGIGILELALKSRGWERFRVKKNRRGQWDMDESMDMSRPHYALYTGHESEDERTVILSIYNGQWDRVVSPESVAKFKSIAENNAMGKIIRVMMITSSGAEGINLKNTRYVHILEPFWNFVKIEQVIGRARRLCSHAQLPVDKRTVQVFMYQTVLPETEQTNRDYLALINHDTQDGRPLTTDQILHATAMRKYKINQQVLQVIQEAAIDCRVYQNASRDQSITCYGANIQYSSDEYITSPGELMDAASAAAAVAAAAADPNPIPAEDLNLRKFVYKIIMIGNKKYISDDVDLYDFDAYERDKDFIKVGEWNKETMMEPKIYQQEGDDDSS